MAGAAMRRVWGRANSSNVAKVVWLLDEIGLEYERIDLGGPFGGTHEAGYLAMNPNALVPTLEEDGFTLWESNTILRYLAGQHAAPRALWPAEGRARANVDRWLDWTQTTLGPPQTALFQGLVRAPVEKRDMGAMEAALAATGKVWAVLDTQLERHEYVAGPDFTLADIAPGVHAHRWFSFAIGKPELRHLRRWYERLLERPAYRAHCAPLMT